MTQDSYPHITNVNFVKSRETAEKSILRPFSLNKNQQKYDYMIKLIIVGDSGVGKTNIICAFCNSEYHFNSTHVPTIGVDFSAKIIQMQNKKIKLQVWDTAGQQRFRTITQTYYKGAAGILLVYSVGNRQSFNNTKKWMEQIKEKTSQSVQVVLIANKIDLPDQKLYMQAVVEGSPRTSQQQNFRVVSKRQGWDLAELYGIQYHQVSAKMNDKVQNIFYNMAQMINHQLEEQMDNTILQNQQQINCSYKINHSGGIELSKKNTKRAKIRSKKGIIYQQNGSQLSDQQSGEKSWRKCNC